MVRPSGKPVTAPYSSVKQINFDKELSEVKNYLRDVFPTMVNATLESAVQKIRTVGFKDLGPEYSTLTTAQEAQHHLWRYRMCKKWGAPNKTHANLIAAKTIAETLDYDSKGPKQIGFECEPFIKMCLFKARDRLSTALRNFYRFEPANLRMPNGEGYSSAGGDCSVYAKLRAAKWDITADCVDLFATVCYNTPGLKAAARKHIGVVSRDETRNLYLSYGHTRNVGYHVFKELLLSEVLNIVPGCRIATVPKELDKHRMIACEPFCNMIVQSVIEVGLRKVILEEFDVDLDCSQEVHKVLIRDLSNATVDFSNASNSNWLCWIEWLYPPYLVRQIRAARSPVAMLTTSHPDESALQHEWTMVSPMGNGFTFGLMTLTLLVIARELDNFSHVFGDDVIIDTEVAPSFIAIAEHIGFVVNTKKTFLRGSFRESCGGFTFGEEYIHSFEFTWATHTAQAFALVNKVNYLAHKTGDDALEALAINLRSLVPSLCKRASNTPDDVVFTDEFGDTQVESRFMLVWTANARRQKRQDALVREAVKRISNYRRCKSFLTFHNYRIHDLDFYLECTMEAATYRCEPPRCNANAFWAAHYLHAGRVTLPGFRPTTRRPLQLRVGTRFSTVFSRVGWEYVPTRSYKARAAWFSYPPSRQGYQVGPVIFR